MGPAPFPWHYVLPPFEMLLWLALDLLQARRPDPYYRWCPPRWVYRAVLFTLPLSYPLLIAVAVVAGLLGIVEFIFLALVDLALDLFEGGR